MSRPWFRRSKSTPVTTPATATTPTDNQNDKRVYTGLGSGGGAQVTGAQVMVIPAGAGGVAAHVWASLRGRAAARGVAACGASSPTAGRASAKTTIKANPGAIPRKNIERG
jgi:hypothetical protein